MTHQGKAGGGRSGKRSTIALIAGAVLGLSTGSALAQRMPESATKHFAENQKDWRAFLTAVREGNHEVAVDVGGDAGLSQGQVMQIMQDTRSLADITIGTTAAGGPVITCW